MNLYTTRLKLREENLVRTIQGKLRSCKTLYVRGATKAEFRKFDRNIGDLLGKTLVRAMGYLGVKCTYHFLKGHMSGSPFQILTITFIHPL